MGNTLKVKNKLAYLGIRTYQLASLGVGVGIGKLVHDLLGNLEVSTLTEKGGAVATGLLVSSLLLTFTRRYYFPKCPECDSGRLNQKRKVIGSYEGPTSMKLYYGMRGIQQFTEIEVSSRCDRCNYNSLTSETRPGSISIH